MVPHLGEATPAPTHPFGLEDRSGQISEQERGRRVLGVGVLAAQAVDPVLVEEDLDDQRLGERFAPVLLAQVGINPYESTRTNQPARINLTRRVRR